jgi:hypothetical protein
LRLSYYLASTDSAQGVQMTVDCRDAQQAAWYVVGPSFSRNQLPPWFHAHSGQAAMSAPPWPAGTLDAVVHGYPG